MNLDYGALWGEPLLLIAQGLFVTLQLSAVTLVAALAIGLLVGVARWLEIGWLRPLIWFYIEFARNTPPVVQILFWYFSAPFILPRPIFLVVRDYGLEFGAAVIALSIYHGAFMAEAVRAGLQSVARGQIDAARALGLGPSLSLPRVILPQALRVAVPAIVNDATSLIKNTSLAIAIGVTEMTFQYRAIDNFMFRGVEALTVVTVLYLLICLASAGIGVLATRALSRHARRPAPLLLPEPA